MDAIQKNVLVAALQIQEHLLALLRTCHAVLKQATRFVELLSNGPDVPEGIGIGCDLTGAQRHQVEHTCAQRLDARNFLRNFALFFA